MWFATWNGLYRYDGIQWKSFFHDPLNSNSITANQLECVYVDRQGLLWIGTFNEGLDCLDLSTGTFRHFRHDSLNPASLSQNRISYLLEDREGILWVGTHRGLNRYHPDSGTFTRYRHHPTDSTTLTNDEVRIIYEDRQGTLWIGTGEGDPAEAIPDVGGLNRLDRKRGTFTRYLHQPNDSTSLFDNKIRAILEDSAGNFWVGTRGNILHLMDRSKGTFERVNTANASGKNIAPKLAYKCETFILFIHEDATKALWIGAGNGLHRYDPVTNQVTHYPYIPNTPNPRLEDGYDTETGNITHFDTTATSLAGPKDSGPWWAFTSREGVLWISTLACNLFKYNPFQAYIPKYEVGASVNAFYEDEDGFLWMATGQGLIRHDTRTGLSHRFVHNPADSLSLDDNTVLSIYKDRKSTLWISTAKGLNRFNAHKQTFTHFALPASITGKRPAKSVFRMLEDGKGSPGAVFRMLEDGKGSPGAIYQMLEDKQGNFWVGTSEGLFQLDRERRSWTTYGHIFKSTTSQQKEDQIFTLLEDKQGTLWVGSRSEGGLVQLTPQTSGSKKYLSGASISSLCLDSEGTLWVGTIIGLYLRAGKATDFTRYTPLVEGKIIVGVRYVLEDNEKNLWVSTTRGLIRINKQREGITLYGKHNGVHSGSFNYSAGYKNREGKLFFGDRSGYYAFFPSQAKGNPNPPQVIFTDFYLFDKLVKPGKDSLLRLSIAQTTSISLAHYQNFFLSVLQASTIAIRSITSISL